MIHIAEAGAALSGVGAVLAQVAPIDNKTPATVALAIICLACLGIMLKVVTDGHKASMQLAKEMAENNAQQKTANAQMDALFQKIGSQPCLMANQNTVEIMSDRIADRIGKHP